MSATIGVCPNCGKPAEYSITLSEKVCSIGFFASFCAKHMQDRIKLAIKEISDIERGKRRAPKQLEKMINKALQPPKQPESKDILRRHTQ